MTIRLSAEAEAFLAAQLASGQYPDAAAVIEAALRHLEAEQEWKQYATAAIDEGLAQSERGKFVSPEEIEALLDKYVRKPLETGR
jgi:putative addiction module CopG family antidote